jgi:hypothetical protein
MGSFFNFTLPGMIGGNAVRGYYFYNESKSMPLSADIPCQESEVDGACAAGSADSGRLRFVQIRQDRLYGMLLSEPPRIDC